MACGSGESIFFSTVSCEKVRSSGKTVFLLIKFVSGARSGS